VVSISRSYRAASQVLRRKKDDDYIEAEIVGEEKKKNPLSSWMGGTSFLNGEKKAGGGIFNKLAKVFGQDEESKRKKEQQKAINTAIDKVFEVHCHCILIRRASIVNLNSTFNSLCLHR
jgi:hypothetical protein